jgi:hypothetical protein
LGGYGGHRRRTGRSAPRAGALSERRDAARDVGAVVPAGREELRPRPPRPGRWRRNPPWGRVCAPTPSGRRGRRVSFSGGERCAPAPPRGDVGAVVPAGREESRPPLVLRDVGAVVPARREELRPRPIAPTLAQKPAVGAGLCAQPRRAAGVGAFRPRCRAFCARPSLAPRDVGAVVPAGREELRPRPLRGTLAQKPAVGAGLCAHPIGPPGLARFVLGWRTFGARPSSRGTLAQLCPPGGKNCARAPARRDVGAETRRGGGLVRPPPSPGGG